jgi:hypothetical protein
MVNFMYALPYCTIYVRLSNVPGFDSLRIEIIVFEGRQGEFKKEEFFTQNVFYHELIN